jgi:probable phosphoglycerate mutase
MPPEPETTRLLVLRHGQSAWNAQGRWQGHADVPLDDVGERQAEEAATKVAPFGPFAAVWASDLARARVTAEIVARGVGVDTVQIDPRLRETNVGPWEGLNQAQVEEGWPGYLAARRRPDGFEPYDDAAARMLAAFVDIGRASPGECVLVVSHGGVIRAVRRSLGAVDQHMPNLGGSWFEVDGDGLVRAGDLLVLRERRDRPSEVL